MDLEFPLTSAKTPSSAFTGWNAVAALLATGSASALSPPLPVSMGLVSKWWITVRASNFDFGFRCPERDGIQDRWEPSIQLDQEQAIAVGELDATAHPPLQHNQLMSERRVLCLKSALRLERRAEQGQEEAEQRDNRRSR